MRMHKVLFDVAMTASTDLRNKIVENQNAFGTVCAMKIGFICVCGVCF